MCLYLVVALHARKRLSFALTNFAADFSSKLLGGRFLCKFRGLLPRSSRCTLLSLRAVPNTFILPLFHSLRLRKLSLPLQFSQKKFASRASAMLTE